MGLRNHKGGLGLGILGVNIVHYELLLVYVGVYYPAWLNYLLGIG